MKNMLLVWLTGKDRFWENLFGGNICSIYCTGGRYLISLGSKQIQRGVPSRTFWKDTTYYVNAGDDFHYFYFIFCRSTKVTYRTVLFNIIIIVSHFKMTNNVQTRLRIVKVLGPTLTLCYWSLVYILCYCIRYM